MYGANNSENQKPSTSGIQTQTVIKDSNIIVKYMHMSNGDNVEVSLTLKTTPIIDTYQDR